MAHIIGSSVLTFVLVAEFSGNLGLLIAHIIEASVLTFALAARRKDGGSLLRNLTTPILTGLESS